MHYPSFNDVFILIFWQQINLHLFKTEVQVFSDGNVSSGIMFVTNFTKSDRQYIYMLYNDRQKEGNRQISFLPNGVRLRTQGLVECSRCDLGVKGAGKILLCQPHDQKPHVSKANDKTLTCREILNVHGSSAFIRRFQRRRAPRCSS
jgi:hypothetical protein